MAAEKFLAADHCRRKNLPATVYPEQTPLWERDVAEEMLAFKPPSADLSDVQESLSKSAEKLMESPLESIPLPTSPFINSKVEKKLFQEEDPFQFTEQIPTERKVDIFESYELSAPPLSPKTTKENKRDPIEDFLKASQAHAEQHRDADFFDQEADMEQEEDEEEPFHDVGPSHEEIKKEANIFAAPIAPQSPKPVSHSALDDFDAELEQQLAAFNIGGGVSHAAGPSAGFHPHPPFSGEAPKKKSSPDSDDGWGDDDDEFK